MNRTIRGVDYSFDRANLAELKRLGYRFVIRYLTGSGKALTVAERRDLEAHGLAVGVCYETTAGRAACGPRGRRARRAGCERAAAVNVGLKGIPIYMVSTTPTPPSPGPPLLRGRLPVLGKGKRGAYGAGSCCASSCTPG
jgi:hypothetical protein